MIVSSLDKHGVWQLKDGKVRYYHIELCWDWLS